MYSRVAVLRGDDSADLAVRAAIWLKSSCSIALNIQLFGSFLMRAIAPRLSLTLAVLILSVACNTNPPDGTTENPHRSSQSSVESAADTQQIEVLKIAIIPDRDIEAQERKERLAKLKEYLEEELNLPVDIQFTEDYDTSIDLLVEEKVQMAYLGPFSYVKAKQRNPNLEPLAAPINKSTGRPWYTSSIIVSTDSGINSLADLKGKRFGFVSQSSTSGYLAPSVELKMVGIDPKQDLAATEYAGTHDKNAAALAAGTVDAAAMTKQTFLDAQATGKLPAEQYKLLWESNPLPTNPITINNQMSPELKTRLQKALINAPEGVIGSGVAPAGYTLVQDEDYEPIRRLQDSLEE